MGLAGDLGGFINIVLYFKSYVFIPEGNYCLGFLILLATQSAPDVLWVLLGIGDEIKQTYF